MKTVLTTADVAERKRFQFWQDAVCDTFVELDCQARSAPFFGEITTAECDGLHFSTVNSDGQIVKRTPTRHPPRPRRGDAGQPAVARRRYYRAGRTRGAASSRRLRLLRQHAAIHLEFRRRLRAARAAHAARGDGAPHRPHRGVDRAAHRGHEPGRLASAAVRAGAASIVSDIAPATASQLSETCLSLVTAALGERLGEIAAGGSSARTALSFRAKAMIASNLHDHALNTEKVAQLVGISPRYLQDLFHAEGTTVSDWIWQRRLDKSRRDLADPLRAGDSIAQIALACGFADFGHFSHRYKDAFGTSPREDRARMHSSGCQS